jgi:KAP family P-loop domain
MNKQISSGYDAVQSDQNEDALGRWRFAREIADVIRTTPSGWSARIGIFGKWGEGKSAVLRFLEDMLKPQGNIVLLFNPWAARDLDELWELFGTALLQALSNAGLYVEPKWKSSIRSFDKLMKKTGFADAGEGIADVFGKGKVFKGAFSLVGNWLKPDGPQVQAIRAKLVDQRVIVFHR